MSDEELKQGDTTARYYATKSEQQILIWGLRQYFSFPERSSNRSKIASSVTTMLNTINKHWTHRSVRLWFNNNKKNFFNENHVSTYQLQNQQFLIQQQMQNAYNTQQNAINSSNISLQGSNIIQNQSLPLQAQNIVTQIPASFNAQLQFITNQNQITSSENHEELTSKIKPMEPETVIPITPDIPQKPTNEVQNSIILSPIRPPSPKVRFDMQNMQQREDIHQNVTGYQSMAEIIRKIEKIDQSNDENIFDKLRIEYDNEIGNVMAAEGVCKADMVDAKPPFIRIRSQQDIGYDMLGDNTSDFLLPIKSMSFIDSNDSLIRPSTPDLFSYRTIWQERRYAENKIGTYDSVSISHDYAAYAFSDLLSSEKQISVSKNKDDITKWINFPIPTLSPIEKLVINNNFAWSSTNMKLIKTNLNGPQELDSSIVFDLPDSVGGIPMISCIDDETALIAFPHSRLLYTLKNELLSLPQLNYDITSISSFNESLLCSPSNSFAIRQLTLEGREIRSYIGHCNYIREIIPRDENTFISRGDDNTVRLWDKRSHIPELQILSPTTAVCQGGDYIFLGMTNKGLGMVDIKEGRINLCVQTQDYNAEALSYNQEKDELMMFGIISRDAIKDSMMFIDNNGESRKRVFRKYSNFATL